MLAPMRRRDVFATASLSVALAAALAGQNPPASVHGLVSDPHGLVAGAPVQVKSKTTGSAARTISAPDGRYSISNLTPGGYDVTVVMPCCAYNAFNQSVDVAAGENKSFDIRLTETINGTTLGDDPARAAAVMRKRSTIPDKPIPRLAGKPDLSGVWVETGDPYPEQAELLPWAQEITRQRLANFGVDAPHNHCLPGSPPLPAASTPFIGKIVQTPKLLVLLFEDVPGFRQIFLDSRGHPPDFEPAWMGHSVGHWESSAQLGRGVVRGQETDTLVVDTIGFNEQSWIGGNFPHTPMMRMTERYRRVSYGRMEIGVTFEDPGALVKPLRRNLTWDLTPQDEMLEFVCENNKPEHLVRK